MWKILQGCFLDEMRHTLHIFCKETMSSTPQEGELSQTSSRNRDVYRFLYPEEYAMGENPESDSHSNTGEEEDRELKKTLTKRKMNREKLNLIDPNTVF